jgi:hypothetical protein
MARVEGHKFPPQLPILHGELRPRQAAAEETELANDAAPIELARYRNGRDLEPKPREGLKAEVYDQDLELAEILARVIRQWLDEE